VLDELGEAHLDRRRPIVYTSADSVFQVAAHVDVVPLETLYAWCGPRARSCRASTWWRA
jgi:phosphopentomutase